MNIAADHIILGVHEFDYLKVRNICILFVKTTFDIFETVESLRCTTFVNDRIRQM